MLFFLSFSTIKCLNAINNYITNNLNNCVIQGRNKNPRILPFLDEKRFKVIFNLPSFYRLENSTLEQNVSYLKIFYNMTFVNAYLTADYSSQMII